MQFSESFSLCSLLDGVGIALTPDGQGDGVAGDFRSDVLHGGTVCEVGGGENGGSDEGDGGEDFQNRFHGGLPFLA